MFAGIDALNISPPLLIVGVINVAITAPSVNRLHWSFGMQFAIKTTSAVAIWTPEHRE